MRKNFLINCLIILAIGFLGQMSLIQFQPLSAATVDDLRNKIQAHNDEIKRLDAEIARYREEISKTKTEASSLKKEIERLELARNKLQADINVTKNKISVAELNINNLNQGIETTSDRIDNNRQVIGLVLRSINQQEQDNLAEILVRERSLADFWNKISQYQDLSARLSNLVDNLEKDRKELEENKQQKEVEKKELSSLEDRLLDQRKITEATKLTKDQLLTVTQNKESNYQKLLAEQIKRRDQVTAEIAKVEEELRYTLDPSSLPPVGRKALSSPVDKWILTQGFGDTSFSRSAQGQAVYSGRGHNGIDLALAIGDNVRSAENGIVLGTGDTDLTCRGASYGKWILIRHNNGLSTLYAHLSAIKVKEGQQVSRGEIIAYGGNTGYSTGPHLHFSVFASGGVQIQSLQSKVPGCGVYRLPLAPYNAYLNPLDYL